METRTHIPISWGRKTPFGPENPCPGERTDPRCLGLEVDLAALRKCLGGLETGHLKPFHVNLRGEEMQIEVDGHGTDLPDPDCLCRPQLTFYFLLSG